MVTALFEKVLYFTSTLVDEESSDKNLKIFTRQECKTSSEPQKMVPYRII